MCKSLRQTARELKLAYSTVRDIVTLYLLTNDLKPRYNPGSRKVTDRAKRLIIRQVNMNPFLTLTEIAQDQGLHRTTVSRHLRAAGYISRVADRSPYLSERHVNLRLEWAEKYKDLDWDKVVFTDESTFSNRNYAPVRVLRPNGTRHEPAYTLPALTQGRVGCNVWGAICKGFKFPLVNIRDEIRGAEPRANKLTLNGDRYAELIVYQYLSKYVADVAAVRGGGWTVEDNVSLHHTRAVKNVRNLCGIQCLDHPPSSPDLNPIEHLWAYLKVRLSRRRQPTTEEGLWEAICDVYENETPQWVLDHIAGSMQTRLNKVVEAKGWYTGY